MQYADESYSFGQGAQVDLNSVPGVKKIIAGANQVTRLPSSRVQKIGGNYQRLLPIPVSLATDADSKPISIGADKTLFLLPGFDLVVSQRISSSWRAKRGYSRSNDF